MQDSDKILARQLLIKTKIYRFLAMVFAAMGFVAFLVIYSSLYDGNPAKAARDPFIILYIIFPFIPAAIFSMRMKKAETQLRKMLGAPGGSEKK